ncbi:NAD(P)/FAD-dependent oxidoreductase [Pseudonocardia sp. RS010]|uniref:NAD(P)/FAD-dependent oxidoreductase n=1 Tax=Pseudonocardia sp. RS010 TaxID=3385979 RepID=UPI0039A35CD3
MSTAEPHDPPYGTAVVIGGSIAGSAAACALAGSFENVLVLERDALPTTPSPRKGVPHSHQFHVLTVGGRTAFEELLPGLTDEAVAAGVPLRDTAADVRYGAKVGWFPRYDSGLQMLMPTRQFLEWLIRKRVGALPGVVFRDRTEVVGLVAQDDRITGVRTRDAAGTEAVVEADLVLDAGGRASKAPEWLAELGFPAPRESTVNAKWGYTTTYFTPRQGWDPGYSAIYLGPTVSGEGLGATRGGAMWEQEDGRWVLTAQGCAGDYPPGDEAGLREYLSSFGAPEFVDVVEDLEVAGPVEAWRNTSNRLRDFAALQVRPERFVAMGDSVAAFNPIYGQGMAVAAFSGRELKAEIADFTREHPDGGLDGFAARFQKRLTAIIQNCWDFSTGSDHAVPGVEVDGVPVEQDVDAEAAGYADRVLALATEDRNVTQKFLETMHLVRTSEWMADGDLRARVLEDWDRLGGFARTAD